ncbi:redox-regulated ATPase YchF [Patescibacteria group bacterium]|nr:MAG: redox-regulated ATPase YchF [Patescibacteria group bacterium]
MSFAIGIVGLPNVGKSTLFKALTRKQALIANYPFATIEPNVGIVEVPDERLAQLAAISKSGRIVPTTINFVDIAGLVRGAAQGEGLGNKFLSHIREVDAIVMVVRVFVDNDIVHVHGQVDPKSDVDVIHAELVIADLETANRRVDTLKSKAKGGVTPLLEKELAAVERVRDALQQGNLASSVALADDEKPPLAELHLLTMKPFLYVLNVDEKTLKEKAYVGPLSNTLAPQIALNAKIEAELADMSPTEAKEMLTALEIPESGLDALIRAAYAKLGLISFLTTGEMETRAWTIPVGTKAPQAAGVIHTDFEKTFIRAEISNWKDFVTQGGEAGVRDKGLLRVEGKDYVMQDGDVVHFRVGA